MPRHRWPQGRTTPLPSALTQTVCANRPPHRMGRPSQCNGAASFFPEAQGGFRLLDAKGYVCDRFCILALCHVEPNRQTQAHPVAGPLFVRPEERRPPPAIRATVPRHHRCRHCFCSVPTLWLRAPLSGPTFEMSSRTENWADCYRRAASPLSRHPTKVTRQTDEMLKQLLLRIPFTHCVWLTLRLTHGVAPSGPEAAIPIVVANPGHISEAAPAKGHPLNRSALDLPDNVRLVQTWTLRWRPTQSVHNR